MISIMKKAKMNRRAKKTAFDSKKRRRQKENDAGSMQS